MVRTASALILVTALAAPAGAQQARSLSPGRTAMPAGVSAGFSLPNRPGVVYFTAIAPWNGWATGWAYQTSDPRLGSSYTFGGYLPGGFVAPTQLPLLTTQPAPAPQPEAPRAPKPVPAVALANEFPATLTVQFPAAAEVWLGGKAVAGEAAGERVLTSPVLKPGERHTFELKARWSDRGKTLEAARTVTLGSGDRSRLLIVSGTEVRE